MNSGKKAYWLRGNNETTPAVQTSITQAINNRLFLFYLKTLKHLLSAYWGIEWPSGSLLNSVILER